MKRIMSNEKSDCSINARSFDALEVYSPVANRDVQAESYSVNSPQKKLENRYKLPNIKNKNNWTEDYSQLSFDNKSKEKESNEPTSNTGISSNKHVEIYIGELSPSKNLHFEISKNTNKLYLIGGNKEAKLESYSVLSNNADEKQSSYSNASSFAEVFKRHKDDLIIQDKIENINTEAKQNFKNKRLHFKDEGKKIASQKISKHDQYDYIDEIVQKRKHSNLYQSKSSNKILDSSKDTKMLLNSNINRTLEKTQGHHKINQSFDYKMKSIAKIHPLKQNSILNKEIKIKMNSSSK